MGFLKFIFIFLLVLYIGGIIGRFLLRRWILKQQKEFKRTGSNFKTYTWGTGRRAQSGASTDRVEGEISVEQTARTQKRVSKQVGDYVDYEEVNEP